MYSNNIIMGILCILIIHLILAFGNISYKLAMDIANPIEINVLKFLGISFISLPFLFIKKYRCTKYVHKICIIRAIMLTFTELLVIYGFGSIRYSLISIIIMTASWFSIIADILYFHSKPDNSIYIGGTFGFIGVMLILQPWNDYNISLEVIIIFLCPIIWAAHDIVIRNVSKLGNDVGQWMYVNFYQTIFSILILLLSYNTNFLNMEFNIFKNSLIPDFNTFDLYFTLIILCMIVLFALAFFLFYFSYRNCPVHILAPFYFIGIVYSTILGYLFFDDLPNIFEVVGILIILISVNYILYRQLILR